MFNTVKEVETRGLTITQYEHLCFLLYRSEYTSYNIVSMIDKTGDTEKFVGHAGVICSQEYNKAIELDDFPINADLYICPNGSATPFSRKSQYITNIQNFVIDIDAHNTTLTADELNAHIDQFETTLLDGLIVKPNYINHTGRGLHLWYCFQPCIKSMKRIVDSTIDMVIQNVKDIMKNEEVLTLDSPSSFKLNGLFRIPYSYNTKVERWSYGNMIHEELPNINDIRNILKEAGYTSNYFAEKQKSNYNPKKYKKEICIQEVIDYQPCLLHRERFIHHLLKTRTINKGQRDLMLFATYTVLCKLYDKENARSQLEEINSSFSNPLPEAEVLSICNEIERKQHKFSNERFLHFIQATEAERAWFNKSSREQIAQQKRDEKQKRNEEIIKCHNDGMNISAIARMFNIKRDTVYSVLRGVQGGEPTAEKV